MKPQTVYTRRKLINNNLNMSIMENRLVKMKIEKILFAFILMFSLNNFAISSSNIPTDGLIAYYPLNGDGADEGRGAPREAYECKGERQETTGAGRLPGGRVWNRQFSRCRWQPIIDHTVGADAGVEEDDLGPLSFAGRSSRRGARHRR